MDPSQYWLIESSRRFDAWLWHTQGVQRALVTQSIKGDGFFFCDQHIHPQIVMFQGDVT